MNSKTVSLAYVWDDRMPYKGPISRKLLCRLILIYFQMEKKFYISYRNLGYRIFSDCRLYLMTTPAIMSTVSFDSLILRNNSVAFN